MADRYGRLSLRDLLARNKATLDMYAAMSGQEPKPSTWVLPPKRATPQRNPDRVSERTMLAAVLKALRKHPRVARVRRQQAGSVMAGDRYIRLGKTGGLDIQGMLKGGRHFECEVKGEGGKVSAEQQKEIDSINYHGGLAFAAWSVDDVNRALD